MHVANEKYFVSPFLIGFAKKQPGACDTLIDSMGVFTCLRAELEKKSDARREQICAGIRKDARIRELTM